MPHLHVKEFKKVDFPCQEDGVKFDFIAKNINRDDEELISATIDGESFFLIQKKDAKKNLLKSDKLTRVASTYNVHKALLSYAKLANLEIISSNVVQTKKNIHLQEVNALKDIGFFTQTFFKDKKVSIEVGFGSGRHLLHQASQNKDILFIGIEIHRPSIEQVLKQINIQKLDNILLLDYDARLFMEFVPSNIVEKIFVHFPVPWDKKPHRRVISTAFITEARRVLKVGGTLELRTDSENYYAYSYETFISFDKTTLHINKNKDIAISSKYEDRWKKMQKNIYDITMINDKLSEPLVFEGSFDFEDVTLSVDEIAKLHNKTKKFQNCFIHFERVYKIGNDGAMLRISMGSFDRPEHLFVIIKGTKASYFKTLPLKSKGNLLAHKHLDGILHG